MKKVGGKLGTCPERGVSLVNTLVGIVLMSLIAMLFAIGLKKVFKSSYEARLSGEFGNIISALREASTRTITSHLEKTAPAALCEKSSLSSLYDSWSVAIPSTMFKLTVTTDFGDARLAAVKSRCSAANQTHLGSPNHFRNEKSIFYCGTIDAKNSDSDPTGMFEDRQFVVEALVEFLDLTTDDKVKCRDLYDSSKVDTPAIRLVGRLSWIDTSARADKSQRVRSIPFIDFEPLHLDRDD